MNHKVGTAIMSFFTFVPKFLNILNMNWIFSSLYLYLYWNLYRPVIWLWDLFRKLWIVIGIKILNLVARVYDVKWSQRPCLPYDYSWIWSHFVPHMDLGVLVCLYIYCAHLPTNPSDWSFQLKLLSKIAFLLWKRGGGEERKGRI